MPIQIDKVKYQIHKASGTLDRYKGDLVGALIGQKYTPNDQSALLRYAIQGLKLEKFQEFNTFANECVATVNEWFAEMEK
jgi:hypothetical protein